MAYQPKVGDKVILKRTPDWRAGAECLDGAAGIIEEITTFNQYSIRLLHTPEGWGSDRAITYIDSLRPRPTAEALYE